MGKVSLWADAPTNTGHDVGIDLVAEDELVADDGSGRYWAIQCKAYVPTETLTYDDCSTFWAKGVPDPAYARYMSLYRPFCKEWLYYDERLIEMTYQQPRLFPLVEDERAKGPTSNPIPLSKSALTTHREVEGKGGEMTYQQRPLHCLSNVTIMVPGKSNSGFNCLITNNVPDLNAMTMMRGWV